MKCPLLSAASTSRPIARVVVACASLLLSGQLAGAQTCSPPGLVAWWPGQGNAVDVTGAHNGTLVGGVTFAPGIVGSAFSFDGTNAVQVPDSPSLNPTNAITVEAWLNPPGTAVPICGSDPDSLKALTRALARLEALTIAKSWREDALRRED